MESIIITPNDNIGAIHVGNSLVAPVASMDVIRDFALELVPMIANLSGMVWMPLVCNCSFANSTKSIVMYKKIWKNDSCNDLKKFHSHSPETIIFEDSNKVSFMTIIQARQEEFLSIYEMVGAYNKNKFIMIVPPSYEMLDYVGVISDLLKAHQNSGVVDIRSLFVDILCRIDHIIVSSTWGCADDWDCGIGFYANKKSRLFQELSNSIMNKFSTCKNVKIETEPIVYL